MEQTCNRTLQPRNGLFYDLFKRRTSVGNASNWLGTGVFCLGMLEAGAIPLLSQLATFKFETQVSCSKEL